MEQLMKKDSDFIRKFVDLFADQKHTDNLQNTIESMLDHYMRNRNYNRYFVTVTGFENNLTVDIVVDQNTYTFDLNEMEF